MSRYYSIHTTAAAIGWSGPCVVAAETQARILVTAPIFFYFLRIRLLPQYIDVVEFGCSRRKPGLSPGDGKLSPFISPNKTSSRYIYLLLDIQMRSLSLAYDGTPCDFAMLFFASCSCYV